MKSNPRIAQRQLQAMTRTTKCVPGDYGTVTKLQYIAISVVGVAATVCMAQTRPTIIDAGEPFAASRPSEKARPHNRTKYRLANNVSAPDSHKLGQLQEVDLGVTLWQLRSAAPKDSGARMLVHEPGSSTKVEVTPERIQSETVLNEGEQVRLSIESPRRGYLYVIDQEEYADGTRGDAYIVFPTTRTRGGDNELTPGKLIEIPGRSDDPNYFTIKKGRSDQVKEVLTLLETPQLLPDVKPGDEPIKLAPDKFQGWQKRWGTEAQRLEMEGGAGRNWTENEKEAGSEGAASRALASDDPLPETIYRAWAKPGSPAMVTVPLRVSN